jgi:hypothetical protein
MNQVIPSDEDMGEAEDLIKGIRENIWEEQ